METLRRPGLCSPFESLAPWLAEPRPTVQGAVLLWRKTFHRQHGAQTQSCAGALARNFFVLVFISLTVYTEADSPYPVVFAAYLQCTYGAPQSPHVQPLPRGTKKLSIGNLHRAKRIVFLNVVWFSSPNTSHVTMRLDYCTCIVHKGISLSKTRDSHKHIFIEERTKFDFSRPRKVEPPVENSNFSGLEMERDRRTTGPFHF